jgi:hypothetical protein
MAAGTIGDVKLLAPLRERDFALLWTGMTVSLLGDGIFIVAEAWQVYDIHTIRWPCRWSASRGPEA